MLTKVSSVDWVSIEISNECPLRCRHLTLFFPGWLTSGHPASKLGVLLYLLAFCQLGWMVACTVSSWLLLQFFMVRQLNFSAPLKSTTLKYFKFMLIFLFYYLDSRLVNSVDNLPSPSLFTSWELAKSDVKWPDSFPISSMTSPYS